MPAHAPVGPSVRELAELNRRKIEEMIELIHSLCWGGETFEEILRLLFAWLGLRMNFEQYVLVGSTVRSYLSWLKDTGKMAAEFQDSMLLWQRV